MFETLTTDRLKRFTPLDQLEDPYLEVITRRSELIRADKGKLLLHRGSNTPHTFYLLSGKVELTAADGNTHQIAAESDRAKAPIAQLVPRIYDVSALSHVVFLKISRDLLVEIFRHKERMSGATRTARHGPIRSQDPLESPIYQDILSDLNDHRMTLPSQPDTALQVNRLVQEEDYGIDEIARLVLSDPAMTAKLLMVANSAYYRSTKHIDHGLDAIVRLGAEKVRDLVMLFALREVFNSKLEYLNKRLRQLWDHSRDTAATCLARIAHRL
ncbi:MAG: HDOD domain-containing protein, partial [Chromatiales bacterium]|nr:HDOD domain-containing protein [Chromatiales bacterium]